MGEGGLSVVVFSKSSQNISLQIYQIFWGNGESTGKTIKAGIKKAGEALRPAGLNFKYQPTNSYLLEP